jgi:putative ABC transport system permease protein
MILAAFFMALKELRRNVTRSILTMLGIVIGVCSVIALVNIGEGTTQKVSQDIGKLGDNLLIINPGAGRRSATFVQAPAFTQDDVEAIRREITSVSKVAPTASSQQLIVWGNSNYQAAVTGSNNDYLPVRGYTLKTGRNFASSELSSGRGVCILGETIRAELFGSVEAVGETIRVGKVSCTVIGLLQAKGQSGMGQDQDAVVLMPLRAVQRRILGTTDISGIFVSAKSAAQTTTAETQITGLLRERRRIPAGADLDFSVRNMKEIAETMSAATGSLTALLGAIAAVSLVVGGIGIMNIMLVSVTERTREIGIRLAIGALAGDVLIQFLIEAVVLSTLGGVIGIGLGLGVSYSVTNAMGVPFLIQPSVLFLAFGFSAAVGVLFGYLPAHKAAKLNPIEALRHE